MKGFLFVTSLSFGALVFQARREPYGTGQAATFALVALFLWPVAGALVTVLTGGLRHFAFFGKKKDYKPLTGDERAGLAAVWPLSLVYALAVYPTMWLIYLFFPEK